MAIHIGIAVAVQIGSGFRIEMYVIDPSKVVIYDSLVPAGMGDFPECRDRRHTLERSFRAKNAIEELCSAEPLHVVASCGDNVTRGACSSLESTLPISGMGVSVGNLCSIQRHSYKRSVPDNSLQ
jgi:hypothetical protein